MGNSVVAGSNMDERPGTGLRVVLPQRAVRRGRGRVGTIGRVLAGLAMVAGAGVLVATTASAADGSDLFLRNWATGLCLDSRDDGSVYTRQCDAGNSAQHWNLTFHPGSGGADAANIQSERLGGAYLGRPVGAVTQVDLHGGYAYWLGDGPNWQQVRLRLWAPDINGVAWCLDSNGPDSNGHGTVYLEPCNDGGNQKWRWGY